MMRTPEPKSGGLQRIVYDMGRVMVSRGHEVTLVGAEGSQLEGATVVEACPPRLGDPSTEKAVADAALATEYDVILDASHTHQAAYKEPKKSVLWHHDVTPVERHPRAVFVSESQRTHTYKGKHGARVIINGLFSPTLPSGTPKDVALFIGNIVPHKGAALAIHIARRLGIRLWVAGKMIDPVYGNIIYNMCDGQQIIYVGALNEQEKYRALVQARMTILCPNSGLSGHSEVGPLTMIESAFMGTPVLSTANGAMKEYVVPEIGRIGKNLTQMLQRAEEVWNMKQEHQKDIMLAAFQRHSLAAKGDEWEDVLCL
jgi:glycosyltransferase involved in cell wall biosynthesis